MADFDYIDSNEALLELCDALRGQPWLAVDTEFIREKTYFPRLCLVQIASAARIACIDPLAGIELEPLFELLYDRSVTKVLHASSQDLEIFAHLKGSVPGPVFDSQVAAPLLGFPEQMGYGNFVRERLGVNLDKAHSRTDWSRRPLGQDQLAYAADDVRYLAALYPALLQDLEEAGRLQWLEDEFASLESVDRYRVDPEAAWLRVRGHEKLRPRALSILQLLARWREERAVARDLPRAWILKDDVLIDIARLAPASAKEFGRIRNLQSRTLERYGDTLLDLVGQGRERDPDPVPDERVRSARPTPAEDLLADLMQAQLRAIALHHDINSAVLASRKDLVALARGDRDMRLMRGWRRRMAGDELLELLDGRRSLSITDGQVIISNTQG